MSQLAFLAIQCRPKPDAEPGDFLFSKVNGDCYYELVSPVFDGLVELFLWNRENGWKESWAGEFKVYEKDEP